MNQESIKNKTRRGCLLMLWLRTAIGNTMDWRCCDEKRKKYEKYWKGGKNTFTDDMIIHGTPSKLT